MKIIKRKSSKTEKLFIPSKRMESSRKVITRDNSINLLGEKVNKFLFLFIKMVTHFYEFTFLIILME